MLLSRLLAAPQPRQRQQPRQQRQPGDQKDPPPSLTTALITAPTAAPSTPPEDDSQREEEEEEEEEEAIEDVFSDALSLLFPDDVRNQHGLPGSRIVYRSPCYGEIDLLLADPTEQDDRLLFAHYLWNANILLTDLIERDCCAADEARGGSRDDTEGGTGDGAGGDTGDGTGCGAGGQVQETTDDLATAVPADDARDASAPVHTMTDELPAGSDRRKTSKTRWNVRGKKVLELGAGTGLCGIVCALAGAKKVTVTDYPSPMLLSTLERNVQENLFPTLSCGARTHGLSSSSSLPSSSTITTARSAAAAEATNDSFNDSSSEQRPQLCPGTVSVRGHKWGEPGFRHGRRQPWRASHPAQASDNRCTSSLSAGAGVGIDDGEGDPASASAPAPPSRIQPPGVRVENLIEDDDDDDDDDDDGDGDNDYDDDDDDHAYDIVIATDCLWLEGQHEHLIESMILFLAWSPPTTTMTTATTAAATGSETSGADHPGGAPNHDKAAKTIKENFQATESDEGPEIWITAGFHTGRHVISSFLASVQAHSSSSTISTTTPIFPSSSSSSSSSPSSSPCYPSNQQPRPREGSCPSNKRPRPRKGSLTLRTIYEKNMRGVTRSFEPARPEEGLDERKKWIVVIVLGWGDG